MKSLLTQSQIEEHVQDALSQEVLNQILYDLAHEDGKWSILQLLCDLGTQSKENYLILRNYTECGDRHVRGEGAAAVMAILDKARTLGSIGGGRIT